MNFKNLAKYWLPVVLWAIIIFYLSSIPNLKTSQDPFWDNIFRHVLHFLEYGFFSLLWWRALRRLNSSTRIFFTFLAVFLYSLSDEIHQRFIPTRSGNLADILIDNLGNLLAIYLVRSYFSKTAPILKNWLKENDFIEKGGRLDQT